MRILDRLKKNPVDKMDYRELREEEHRLKNQVERTRKDINKLEKDKKKKFEEGIGADRMKKKMLTQEIKQIDMEAKGNLKIFNSLHNQYTLVTNLATIKKFENQLKKNEMWDKLTQVTPEQLESALIKVNLSNKEFNEVVSDLNRVIGMDWEEEEEEEEDNQLYDAWESVEAGSMEIDDAVKNISVEQDMEKEE